MIVFKKSITKKIPTQSDYLIAVIGQSNAIGTGLVSQLPARLTGQLPRCYYWNNTWQALEAGVSTSTVGLMYELAYQLSLRYKSKNIRIVLLGVSGTELGQNAGSDWHPDSEELFTTFVNKWNAAKATLVSVYALGICWMQGESDAQLESLANAYQANEQYFVEQIRAETGAAKFITANIHDSLPSGSFPYSAEVRAAKIANLNAGYVDGFINTDEFGLSADNIHFNTAGQIALGLAFYQYLK